MQLNGIFSCVGFETKRISNWCDIELIIFPFFLRLHCCHQWARIFFQKWMGTRIKMSQSAHATRCCLMYSSLINWNDGALICKYLVGLLFVIELLDAPMVSLSKWNTQVVSEGSTSWGQWGGYNADRLKGRLHGVSANGRHHTTNI